MLLDRNEVTFHATVGWACYLSNRVYTSAILKIVALILTNLGFAPSIPHPYRPGDHREDEDRPDADDGDVERADEIFIVRESDVPGRLADPAKVPGIVGIG